MAVVLYIVALVLLVLAALGDRITERVHLGWLGLALWLFTFALLPHIN